MAGRSPSPRRRQSSSRREPPAPGPTGRCCCAGDDRPSRHRPRRRSSTCVSPRRGCSRRSSRTSWRPVGPNRSTGSGASRSCASPVPTRCSRSRVPRWSSTPSTGPSAPCRTRSSPKGSRSCRSTSTSTGARSSPARACPTRARTTTIRCCGRCAASPRRAFRCPSRWASTGVTSSWPRSGPPAGRRTPRWAIRRTPPLASPRGRRWERSTRIRRSSSTRWTCVRGHARGAVPLQRQAGAAHPLRGRRRDRHPHDRHQGATAARRPRPDVGRPRGHARGASEWRGWGADAARGQRDGQEPAAGGGGGVGGRARRTGGCPRRGPVAPSRTVRRQQRLRRLPGPVAHPARGRRKGPPPTWCRASPSGWPPRPLARPAAPAPRRRDAPRGAADPGERGHRSAVPPGRGGRGGGHRPRRHHRGAPADPRGRRGAGRRRLRGPAGAAGGGDRASAVVAAGGAPRHRRRVLADDWPAVALPPLDERVLRALLTDATEAAPLRPHQVDAIVARADGNPLFVEELARTAHDLDSADAVPDSLQGAMAAQIDALDSATRRLLRYASILGRAFRIDTLVEVLTAEDITVDAASLVAASSFVDRDGPDRPAVPQRSHPGRRLRRAAVPGPQPAAPGRRGGDRTGPRRRGRGRTRAALLAVVVTRNGRGATPVSPPIGPAPPTPTPMPRRSTSRRSTRPAGSRSSRPVNGCGS